MQEFFQNYIVCSELSHRHIYIRNTDRKQLIIAEAKARFPQAKSECDWLVMSSVFVTSQSSCFFLCSREQIRQVENRLNGVRKFRKRAAASVVITY